MIPRLPNDFGAGPSGREWISVGFSQAFSLGFNITGFQPGFREADASYSAAIVFLVSLLSPVCESFPKSRMSFFPCGHFCDGIGWDGTENKADAGVREHIH